MWHTYLFKSSPSTFCKKQKQKIKKNTCFHWRFLIFSNKSYPMLFPSKHQLFPFPFQVKWASWVLRCTSFPYRCRIYYRCSLFDEVFCIPRLRISITTLRSDWTHIYKKLAFHGCWAISFNQSACSFHIPSFPSTAACDAFELILTKREYFIATDARC